MLAGWRAIGPEPAFPQELLDADPADPRTILFCAAGWRSALAAKSLEDTGFEYIAHVDGGFTALKRAGAVAVTGADRDASAQPAGDKRD